MKNIPHVIALTALVGLAATLSAQTTDDTPRDPRGRGPGGPGGHGGPGGFGRGPGHHVIRVLDNDQDRELSASELANAPSNLRALDVNTDGSVTRDELRPPRPADAPTPPADRPARPIDAEHPRPMDPIMLALDANSDGSLSTAEIINATASLKALDSNQDGKLTPDEFMPLPPEGAPTGGRGRHRGPPPSATNG